MFKVLFSTSALKDSVLGDSDYVMSFCISGANFGLKFSVKDAVDSVTSPLPAWERRGGEMGALCMLCMDYIWRTVILALSRYL